MKIEPHIAQRHWEAAAVDQVASNLRAEGYDVGRETWLHDSNAYLVARKGPETLVYGFAVPGARDPQWGSQMARLRERVKREGGRFKVVFVRPPRQTRIEIDGIESTLEQAIRENHGILVDDKPADVRVDKVRDVSIDELDVHHEIMTVRGAGTVAVTVVDGKGDTLMDDDFPFTFDLELERDGKLRRVRNVAVDISPWFEEPGASPVS